MIYKGYVQIPYVSYLRFENCGFWYSVKSCWHRYKLTAILPFMLEPLPKHTDIFPSIVTGFFFFFKISKYLIRVISLSCVFYSFSSKSNRNPEFSCLKEKEKLPTRAGKRTPQKFTHSHVQPNFANLFSLIYWFPSSCKECLSDAICKAYDTNRRAPNNQEALMFLASKLFGIIWCGLC